MVDNHNATNQTISEIHHKVVSAALLLEQGHFSLFQLPIAFPSFILPRQLHQLSSATPPFFFFSFLGPISISMRIDRTDCLQDSDFRQSQHIVQTPLTTLLSR